MSLLALLAVALLGLEDHCRESLGYCRRCNSVWRSSIAWFGFAEETSADGEEGAGAGMESVYVCPQGLDV